MGIPSKKQIESDLKLYESIDDLILYNFDRYMATKDNNWFIIGYTGREKKIESERLKNIEEYILEEYFNAIDDQGFKNKIRSWAKIDNLITKYNVVSSLVHRISIGFDITPGDQETRYNFIKMLGEYRYKMPVMNSPHGDLVECERIMTELQGIQTQIAMLQDTLKTEGKSDKISLQRQLKIIEIALQISYRLNPKEMTVSEYIEYGKLMQEKAKQN